MVIGAAVGIVFGGGIRKNWSGNVEVKTPISPSSYVSKVADLRSHADLAATMPRPTLDEVMGAPDDAKTGLFIRYLREASIDELIGLLETSGEVRDLAHLRWLVFKRGVAVDPMALIAWAETQPENVEYMLREIFSQWALVDPDAALVASRGQSKRIRESTLNVVGRTDPDKAIAILSEENPESYVLRRLQQAQQEKLAESDPQRAAMTAAALPAGAERERALVSAIKVWAKQDAAAALAWLETSEDLGDLVSLYQSVLTQLAKTDPVLAMRRAEGLPKSRRRSEIEGDITKAWAKEAPEVALSWIRNLPASNRRDFLFAHASAGLDAKPGELLAMIVEMGINPIQADQFTSIDINTRGHGWSIGGGDAGLAQRVRSAMVSLAGESPREAMSYLAKLPLASYDRSDWGRNVMEAWATSDPLEAASFAFDLPDSPVAGPLQQTAVNAWGKKAPVEVSQFLQSRDLVETKPSLAANFAKDWMASDLDGALKWAHGLTEQAREDLLTNTVGTITKEDPARAIEQLILVQSPDKYRKGIESIAQSWRDQDPQAAFQWLHEGPDEWEVNDVVKATSKAWVLAKPLEASQVIGNLEAGLRRDHAVAGMVHALISSRNASRDFTAAATWAEAIADSALREEWLNEVQNRLSKENSGRDSGVNAGAGFGVIDMEASMSVTIE